MKSFNDIDEVYVVNLPERTDRATQIADELGKHGISYSLFEAVKNNNGVLGLLDSMKRLFTEAISKNQSNIMVLEDDATFLAPPIDFLNTVIPQLPEDYHCLYLGINLVHPPKRYSENLWAVKRAYATHAIIYSREAMEQILVLLQDHVTAYDIILMNQFQWRNKCYCTMPLLCQQRPGYSDIEKRWIDWGALMTQSFNQYTRFETPPDVKKNITYPPCHDAHRVGSVIPTEDRTDLHGSMCNCGRYKYVAEECGCPGRKELRLRTYPNE